MKYRELGRTGLKVSLIALGTMTWGEQNTEAEAHEQLDVALGAGINLVDTAEMYPVPPKAETQGLTEQYIGTWLKKTGRRNDIVLASKAAGPVHEPTRPSHVRGGRLAFNRVNLFEAVNDSLKRLQTDYLDLYQLHWPNRRTAIFGQRNYRHHADEVAVPILETLEALRDLVKAGKIRHFGVSNESPWGLGRFIHHAEVNNELPRVASIQNAYSLVNRTFELGLSEIALHENVGLLAYSSLGQGYLTGKYRDGALPEGSRKALYQRLGRYEKVRADEAIASYLDLAASFGMDPAAFAYRWADSKPWVTSTLIGASSMAQLTADIDAFDLPWTAEMDAAVDALHNRQPNPCP